jgi:signal-transduction protein with cAMP-binding, CBS, and nucleotidyltransferase domain
MEKVADVLGRKYPQFNTIPPDHCVSDALYQMAAENVDYLIVLDNEQFTGIVCSTDIANKVLLADRSLKQVKVSDCTNKNLPVATLSDSVEYGMELLERFNTKYLVVYDRFDFKGIVTSYDLMQHALSKRAGPVHHDRPLL